MTVITKVRRRTDFSKKTVKPAVITWKGVRMVRSHSIRTAAHEIKNMSDNQDFVPINVIGKQSTGKTEIMRTLAHLIHEESKYDYDVNFFGRSELLNLEETVKNLTPTNQILILDDIAFLQANANAQKIKEIESIMSVIRHLPGGKDVRVIMFKSFQYTKALTPFLRQNEGTIVSSVDDAELNNLIEILGKRYTLKINQLKKLRAQILVGDEKASTFTVPLGTKGQHVTYRTKDPFLPYLFKTGIGCRIIVSPKREWIAPICATCSPLSKGDESKTNLDAFLRDFQPKFNDIYNVKTAIRLKLKQHGINCFSPRIQQIGKYIDDYLGEKLINLEELALHYDIEPRRTLLPSSKKPRVVGDKPPVHDKE